MNVKPKIRYINAGSQHVRGKRGANPKGFCLHTMDGMTDRDGRLEGWFDNPESGGAAHYGVGFSGMISNYVSPEYIVVANSSKWANKWLISGEAADQGNPDDTVRTKELYRSLAHLVAYLSYRYHWGKIIFNKNFFIHRQFTNEKPCPGRLDYERVIREANKLLASWRAAEVEPTPQVLATEPSYIGNTSAEVEAKLPKNNPAEPFWPEYEHDVKTTKSAMASLLGALTYPIFAFFENIPKKFKALVFAIASITISLSVVYLPGINWDSIAKQVGLPGFTGIALLLVPLSNQVIDWLRMIGDYFAKRAEEEAKVNSW